MNSHSLILSLREVKKVYPNGVCFDQKNSKLECFSTTEVVPIFSDIVILSIKNNYGLLQVGDMNSAFQLAIQRGEGSQDTITVFLMRNKMFYKQISLRTRLHWALAALSPGAYELYINDTLAFHFKLVP